MLHSSPLCSAAKILATSTTVSVPNATVIAARGWVRRHNRVSATTTATVSATGRDARGGGGRARAPPHILAEHRLHGRPQHDHGDEPPVPPHSDRRMRRARFGPQRLEGVSRHARSVGRTAPWRISRKYEAGAVPPARTTQARRRMCHRGRRVTVVPDTATHSLERTGSAPQRIDRPT